MAEKTEITWDPEADRRIKRSPFLMRRFIRKRIEDRVGDRSPWKGGLAGPDIFCLFYLNRYWRYMRALSSTSASVTWLRPREATRSSMRLRIKRRMRKGLRLMRRSASGSHVICCSSGNVHLFQRVLAF